MSQTLCRSRDLSRARTSSRTHRSGLTNNRSITIADRAKGHLQARTTSHRSNPCSASGFGPGFRRVTKLSHYRNLRLLTTRLLIHQTSARVKFNDSVKGEAMHRSIMRRRVALLSLSSLLVALVTAFGGAAATASATGARASALTTSSLGKFSATFAG